MLTSSFPSFPPAQPLLPNLNNDFIRIQQREHNQHNQHTQQHHDRTLVTMNNAVGNNGSDPHMYGQPRPSLSSSLSFQPPPPDSVPMTAQLPDLAPSAPASFNSKKKAARRRAGASDPKRRCISTACIACRKRKSKCDGAIPSCAACASVYGTECIYDPNSDHRRKGVYKDKVDSMKARNSTLQILIEAILNSSEDEAFNIVRKIRTCESLDMVAEHIMRQEQEGGEDEPVVSHEEHDVGPSLVIDGERDLARKMGELRLEGGAVRYIGGTSHLIYLGDPNDNPDMDGQHDNYPPGTNPITTWTRVTDDADLITLLLDKYFTYHYPYFTTLSRKMFQRDYIKGRPGLVGHTGTVYCSSLLINAMLALGCHFTDVPGAYGTLDDTRTKGDHFFAEAKRLIIENDEYEKPRLVTVQALALMSVREAGCGREAKGWVYSGMSFRMAQDIGLNLEIGALEKERMSEHEIDARRITFWGCFLFDKAWSNYLGRIPLLPNGSFNVSKYEVFPDEDSELWAPFPDTGVDQSLAQPSRIRAAALQMSKLCEISSDLLIFFYHPNHIGRSSGRAVELKKLSELHRRLEEWRRQLPMEFEPKEGQLPNVILMHMFFHLQYIHLFRPFLKYAPSTSPLPAHVSPRRICTANAGAISKLMRLYKKTWNLRQICNIAVYMLHSACTIHLLNLPEKTARRDITHGIRHLEEIAEDWLCARRTLSILSMLAKKWNCELPEDAAVVLQRTDDKYGSYANSMSSASPNSNMMASPTLSEGVPNSRPSIESHMMMGHPFGHSQLPTMPGPAPPLSRGLSMMSHNSDHLSQAPPMHHPQPGPPPGIVDTSPPGMSRTNSSTEPMGWNPQPQPLTNMSFPPMFSPVPPSTSGSISGHSAGEPPMPHHAPSFRHGHSNSVSMDSPDWFLRDSVHWHQSFESWDMHGNGTGTPTSGGNGQMFMFGGENRSTPSDGSRDLGQLDGFDGLGASLNNGGWLTGLD